MSLLLFARNTTKPPPPAEVKVRNKTGIRTIFDKAMASGEKVTLAQAIAILEARW